MRKTKKIVQPSPIGLIGLSIVGGATLVGGIYNYEMHKRQLREEYLASEGLGEVKTGGTTTSSELEEKEKLS